MKKFVLAACLLLPLVFCSQVTAAENPTQGAWDSAPSPDAEAAKAEIVAEPILNLTKWREGPTRRERRAMGLTLPNVWRVVNELREDESVCLDDCCRVEVATLVGERLLAENPAAYQDVAIDMDRWEEILEIIMGLLKFIMTIIGMLS